MIGGTFAEMELVLLALDALARDLAGNESPALDRVRRDVSAVLSRHQTSNGAGRVGGCEGDDMTPLAPLLYDYHQAAARLAVSVSTVERAVRSGRLPVVRIGRSARFQPEALEQFVAELATRKDAV